MKNLAVISTHISQSGSIWGILADADQTEEAQKAATERCFFRARFELEYPKGTRLNNVNIQTLGLDDDVCPPEEGSEDTRSVRFTTVVVNQTDETSVVAPYTVPVSKLPAATRAASPHKR